MTALTFTRTSDLTAEILLREIRLELTQTAFAGRTHGKSATYKAGCRGHLCRYIERTRRREMRQRDSLAGLPHGVRPDVRPRDEQRWDSILASVCDNICSATDGKLEMQDMERFLNLIEALRRGQPLAPVGAVLSTAP